MVAGTVQVMEEKDDMKYYFAPMEGITGYVYRNAHHRFFPGADQYFTPFLSPAQNHKLSSREKNDILPGHNAGISLVPQILTNGEGVPNRTSMTIVMYLNKHLYSKNYGMSGAVSVILFFVTVLLSLVVLRVIREPSQEGGA